MNILTPIFQKNSFLLPKYTANASIETGISHLKVNAPKIVSRYFSRYIADTTIKKYPARSINLFATGVPSSPGANVISVETAVALALSSSAVVFFSSRYFIVSLFIFDSGDE